MRDAQSMMDLHILFNGFNHKYAATVHRRSLCIRVCESAIVLIFMIVWLPVVNNSLKVAAIVLSTLFK